MLTKMQIKNHRYSYRWNLAHGFPAPGVTAHNSTVFGTFICGGGSSMGYKLAGYNHLGGVEIDAKVAATYRDNLHPEYLYIEDLRKFNAREDLPPELYELDVLDGSPPCTTFSMAGNRERGWGKEKRFKEGQALQTLDDLVFIYCDTIAKLKPRVCLLENVAGLLRGNAKSYARRIVTRLEECGYRVQSFLLFAANMGVPQLRQRCFFIGIRRDCAQAFNLPALHLNFAEPPIPFGEIEDESDTSRTLSDYFTDLFNRRMPSDKKLADVVRRESGGNKLYTQVITHPNAVLQTLSTSENMIHYKYPRYINAVERIRASSFPADYRFATKSQMTFMTGMCVAPVMMANIASEIYTQWLAPIKKGNA